MKFQDYITEVFNKKPTVKEKELMNKVIDTHGLPPDGLSLIDSQIIRDNRYDWWVILTYHNNLKKYFGLTSDGEMLEDKNKTKSLKWIKDQKFID